MSEIRVDTFKAEDGVSAPQFPNGLQVTGVVTATVLDTSVPFLNVGSNAKLGAAGVVTATSFTGGSFSGTTISGTTGTFSGNVSIGGTLTYEDVTSIDSIGIVTARTGVVSPYADIDDFVSVGSNIHLGNAGVVTATSFVGNGAALTGIDATSIKDSGGNVKVQAQASGAVYTGIHTFTTLHSTTATIGDFVDVGSNIKLGNAGVITATSFVGNGAGLTGVVAVPTGAIMAWPVESAPTGFILCHGQAISRSTYSDLYGLIGVMYGAGDGSANFNLPDYRGQFLRGRANGSANDPDRNGRTDRGDGNSGDNVGTKQDYGLLEHSHGNNSNGGTSNHGFNTNNNNTSVFSKSGHSYGGTQCSSQDIIKRSWGTNNANVNGHVTNNEVRPINIYVNWIIKS